MATKKGEEQEEPKIPVFTVIKNGAILKNIFIVNNDSGPSSALSDQILIIGRHPDCNVMLTHPSISRFHLKIISNPSSQSLSVIDLSSVHGTWISEKKIEPWDRVEIKEGDSLRIGGSSRVYRLHWIPLSQAYDFDTPYIFASDEPMEEEMEEVATIEAYQNENSMPIEEEKSTMIVEMEDQEKEKYEGRDIQSLDLVCEDLSCLFADESLEITMNKDIQSATHILQNRIYSLCDENEEGSESPLKIVGEEKEIPSHCDDEPLVTDSVKLSLAVEGVSVDNDFSGYDIDTHSSEPSFVAEAVCEREPPEICSREVEKRCPFQYDIFRYNHSLESSIVTKVVCESVSSEISSGELENLRAFKDAIGLTDKSSLLVGEIFNVSGNQHNGIRKWSKDAVYGVESPSHNPKRDNSLSDQKPNLLADFDSGYSDEVHPVSETLEETEELKVSTKDDELRDVSTIESVNSSLSAEDAIPETAEGEENQSPQSRCAADGIARSDTIVHSPMRSDKRPSFGSIWLRRGKSAHAIQLRTGKRTVETTLDSVDSDDERHNPENMEDKYLWKEVSCLNGEEDDIFTPDKENFTPNTFLKKSLIRKDKLDGSDDEKHSQDRIGDTMSLKENLSFIEGKEDEIFTPDKENFTPNTFLVKSSKRKDKLVNSDYEKHNQVRTEAISSLDGGAEEEIFTPDKENFTPNTFTQKSSKMKGVLKVEYTNPSRSSPLKVTCSPSTRPKEDLATSTKNENRELRVLQELKPVKRSTHENKVSLRRELLVNKKRQERVPFRSLVGKADGNGISQTWETTSATRSSFPAHYTRTRENIANSVCENAIRQSKRAWTMVVDATTLLNKQSRKNLQLVQGLKQTRLVIPRTVLRELDDMKQRGSSLFRRKTKACPVLEWIEECMAKTGSWIHVQSSAEDGRLTAPTPLTSPQTHRGSSPFSRGVSLGEIVSPTTEDHIIECALMCRKTNSDRQVVLLSEDVTLKIKAMAEGLLCETVQEFRGSLANPFSERFLWNDSSPRGQTWSIMDDVVLREKYSRCPLKRQLKGETAKGLKLILIHNSHYGQWTPIR